MADQTPAVPLPTSDQEFDFEDINSAPAWVDKSWASYDGGPALALPVDLLGEGPYTTITARVGDKVMFVAATPSRPAHFEVVRKEPTGDDSTAKPPQQSAASLEDMLKTGWLAPDDLGPDAKAQVLSRSPRLKDLIEKGLGAPEAVEVDTVLKTA
jgi:hypothetical protein